MKAFLIKRKQLVLVALTFTLCAAVFVNWYYTGRGVTPEKPDTETTEQANLGEARLVSTESDTAIEASAQKNYFASAKIKRDSAFDEEKDILTSIISSKESGEASVTDAQEKLDALLEHKKNEVDIENLISGKLNCEALVILNDKSAEILIPENSLNDNSAIQIKEIIISKTDLLAEKISIIGVKNVVEN
jgi:hypothetical protein